MDKHGAAERTRYRLSRQKLLGDFQIGDSDHPHLRESARVGYTASDTYIRRYDVTDFNHHQVTCITWALSLWNDARDFVPGTTFLAGMAALSPLRITTAVGDES